MAHRDAGSRDQSKNPARECQDALSLAVAYLRATEPDYMQYKLVAAENLLGEPVQAAYRWRLTFKLRQLIPDAMNEVLGAGGELFVEVDLGTRQARLVGRGE